MNIPSYILLDFIKTLPYLVLFIFPFGEHLRHSKRIFLCSFIAYSLVCCTTVTAVILFFGPSMQLRLTISIISILLIASLSHWMLDISPLTTLFLILMCKNYIDTVLLTGSSLSIYFHSESTRFEHILTSLAVMLVTLPLIYLLFKNFLAPAFNSSEHLFFWKYLWILPGFYYFMYRVIIYPYSLTGREDGSPIVHHLILFWISSVLFSYFFLFRVMAETLESARLKEQLRSAELLTVMQKEQYLMLQNSIDETRRNRHDLKQQLIVIKSCIEQENYAAAVNYISHCLDLYSGNVESFCANHAVDSIIRYYVAMARSNDIEASIFVTLPEPFTISEVDFCTLLGNLMLNAVEAGIRKKTGRRMMALRMAPAGNDMLALIISNTYTGPLPIRNGIFYSSKRDGEGIGTVSVRQIVTKYQGLLKYTHENGIFESSILLHLPAKQP